MFFDNAGVKLYYEKSGSGAPLLLLHGWGGRADSFLPVTRDFSQARTVYAVDFPGHGNSPEPPAPWSVTEYMELIWAFIRRMDINGCDIIAHSFGGRVALLLAAEHPEAVLTMETKGIPIALMTARALGVPLVIARRDSRAYEGSAVKINYVSGGDRIETMALARRAVRAGQRALIIDDFMKGGGTLQGMVDMMREFQADVVGVGVMIATRLPEQKLVEGARSLLVLDHFDKERGAAVVRPAAPYAQ